MYLSFILLVQCCFIGSVLTVNIDSKDDENFANTFQALVQKLEEHEQRIRALENVDKNLRREVNELNSVIREKDSYVSRLEALLTRQNEKLHSSGKFAFNEEFDKNVSEGGNRIVHSRRNKLTELGNPQQALQRRNMVPRQSISSNTVDVVAFYAYMSHDEIINSPHHMFIFDHVVTNQGGSYFPHIGTFIAHQHGFYVFSWTVACEATDYAYTEIVRNSDSIGQILTGFTHNIGLQIGTGVIATELNANDVVSIRTHSIRGAKGIVVSRDYVRTSFTGWKLN